jgi:hypothetical protein
MKTPKKQIVIQRRDLLASTPSFVHATAARRNSAGIMEVQGRRRRRAQRRLDRQQERDARMADNVGNTSFVS